MTVLGTITSLAVTDEVAAVGPFKLARVAIVGDPAYHADGSLGVAAALDAATGQQRTILGAWPCGSNGDSNMEYSPRGVKKACTVTPASDLFACAAHGFAAADPVQFYADAGATLPAGIVEGTQYYVIASGLAAGAFKVSAAYGGSTIDVTAAGYGTFTVRKSDLLLKRVMSTGVESAVADQSSLTYHMMVASY